MSLSGTADITAHSQLLSREPRLRDDNSLVIGFVNNMPDTALRTTERQFRELLSVASPNIPVRLRFFSLPELPRSEAGRLYTGQNYKEIGELWAGDVDGLIVTGTEPRETDLRREPYWSAFTKLVDWAEDHAISTVWSCLAAHAVALYTDGIQRRALPEKLSGVFDCVKAADHAIVDGAPSRWRVPHSRYNELPEEALVTNGYRILSRSPEAGADIFVKLGRTAFIFFQGHPEYDPGALLREYRRDVGRFLARERDSYPEMPRDYFDEDSTAAFVEFRKRTLQNQTIDLLSGFPAAEAKRKLRHPARYRDLCVRELVILSGRPKPLL